MLSSNFQINLENFINKFIYNSLNKLEISKLKLCFSISLLIKRIKFLFFKFSELFHVSKRNSSMTNSSPLKKGRKAAKKNSIQYYYYYYF